MSDLDSIKTEKIKRPELKVYLEDLDVTAIAVTSGAGACSLINDPYLMKGKDKVVTLTEEEVDILKEIGEYDIIEKTNDKKEDVMDETTKKELMDQIENLKKELTTTKVGDSLKVFGFDEDLNKSITDALIGLDEEKSESIIKGFNFIIETKDTELEKALKEKDDKKEDENPLKKQLTQENGHDAEVETDKEVSKLDAIKKALDDKKEKK